MSTSPSASPARFDALFYIGSAGLLVAMVIETLAVVGRHTGLPLLGALEIIQTCILLMAASAMLSATLHDAHATVHLLTGRLRPPARRWLLRFSAALSAAFLQSACRRARSCSRSTTGMRTRKASCCVFRFDH